MLSFEEKLSINPLLDSDKMEKTINSTSHPLNEYAKKQFQKALEYYNDDYKVIERAVSSKSSRKFIALYKNNEEIISYYLNKYHSVKPAIGAMCFYLLYYTGDDVKQVNRILHRTPLFKYWNNASQNEDQSIVDWDNIYEETSLDGKSFEYIKTKGEVEIISLKYKR